jgi:hypothetical protein
VLESVAQCGHVLVESVLGAVGVQGADLPRKVGMEASNFARDGGFG